MFLKRILYHSKRFRGEFIYTSAFGIFFALFFSLLFPGKEGVIEMFQVITDTAYGSIFAGFNELDLDAAAWLLWIGFMLGLVNYYIIAISGINIGSKIVPSVDDDAVELFLGTNSITTRRFYVENFIPAIFTQIAILFPIYLIIGIFTGVIHGSTGSFDELALNMVVTVVIGIFYLALTSMMTIITFSKRIGKISGFGYLFLAFIMEIASDSPEYSDYGNISINYYIKPVSTIFGNFDWKPLLVVLSIALIFFLIALWRIKYPDYIQRANAVKMKKIKNLFSGVFSGLISPNSRLAKKYPLFTDQFRLDIRAVIVVIAFITFQQSVIFLTLPNPENLVQALQSSNNPVLSAFSQNHELQKSLLGFLVLKFYATMWVFYGIVVAIIGVSITSRDVRTKTHDLVFSNGISPVRLVFERIMSMVVSFTIIVWSTFFILRGLQIGVIDIDFMTQAGLFLIL